MILAVGDFWSTLSAAGPAHAAELTLGATILAVLVSGAVLGRDSRRMAVIAFGGTLAALAMMYIFSTPSTGEALSASTASGSPVLFVLDHTAIIFRYVALIVLLGVIGLWSSSDADRERHSPEFMTLLLASALGMLLMSSAANLLVMLVAIELASMSSFALVAFDRHRRSAAEAGVKYVLFGATTSGFAIFGASILFGVFQTLDLPTLAHRVEQSLNAMSAAQTALVALSLFALFAGIAFKIAAVPFHFWCPDVFEGASLSVATWLSIASKAAGVVLIVRIAGFFGVADSSRVPSGLSVTICTSLAMLACLTITIGNLAAFGQRSVRRLLAYSSIAHAGYMLAFAAIPAAAGDPLGSASLAIYIVIYALMNFGAFAALAVVADDTGREDIDAFTGIGWRSPITAVSLTLCLLALVGLPPLGGFIAKFWLLWALAGAASAPMLSASDAMRSALWITAAVVVVNTAISLFYYARIIRQMFLRESDAGAAAIRSAGIIKFMVFACAVGLVLTGTILVPAVS